MFRTPFVARASARLVLIVAIAGAASVANAASIHYGDFGPDFPPGAVMYTDVTESSATDAVPLFGVPDLTGDKLDFDPMGFAAAAADLPSDITDGQLNFGLATLEGAGVLSLLVEESGDFTLYGTGTASTSVAAGISITVEILEVDHTALAEPISVFATSSIVRDLPSDGPVILAPWDTTVFVDFGPALTAAKIDYEVGVTKAEVVIDNQLLAISEPQSIASIAKKDFSIMPGVEGDPVPEPTALGLLLLGSLVFVQRRRS